MEEAAAMAMIHSQSQPHLGLQSYGDLKGNGGSSSSGELLHGGGSGTVSPGGSSSSSLRRRSHGDVAILPTGGVGISAPLHRGSKPSPRRHGSGRGGTIDEHAADANYHVWTTDEQAAEAYFHVSAVPGYVTLEDAIGDNTALYRDGSGQPLEAAINDPLVRKASRLYAGQCGREHHQYHRQQSPGPLGTRRGSAMHWIVKKYVHPLQGFLAGIFCCCFMPRDPPSTTTQTKGVEVDLPIIEDDCIPCLPDNPASCNEDLSENDAIKVSSGLQDHVKGRQGEVPGEFEQNSSTVD